MAVKKTFSHEHQNGVLDIDQDLYQKDYSTFNGDQCVCSVELDHDERIIRCTNCGHEIHQNEFTEDVTRCPNCLRDFRVIDI